MTGRSGPPGNGNAETHGAFALKRAIRTLGSRTIDRRTRVGKMLASWCADLAGDLGGIEALSTAQKALIEQAATTRLILDSIDGWLTKQPSLIDRRKRALLPVVRERQSLADALVRYLTALGLERRQRDPLDLGSYLAAQIPAGSRTESPQPRAAGNGQFVATPPPDAPPVARSDAAPAFGPAPSPAPGDAGNPPATSLTGDEVPAS